MSFFGDIRRYVYEEDFFTASLRLILNNNASAKDAFLNYLLSKNNKAQIELLASNFKTAEFRFQSKDFKPYCLDMVLEGDNNVLIFEHKVGSKEGTDQIKNYLGLSKRYPIVECKSFCPLLLYELVSAFC